MLPSLNRKTSARREMIDCFSGLDLRDGARAGSYTSARNLSLRAYPSLCSGPGISSLPDTSGVTDFFTARGRSFTVRSGGLYMDGELLCPVSAPRLSHAVTGNRVFIIPGNLSVDLETGKAVKLDEEKTSGTVIITKRPDGKADFTFSYTSAEDSLEWRTRVGDSDASNQLFTYSYNDVGTLDDVRALFNAETKEWSLPERRVGDNEVALNFVHPSDREIEGSIIIPRDDGRIDENNRNTTHRPLLNTTGAVAVIEKKWIETSSGVDICYLRYRIINLDEPAFTEFFPGESVNISGSREALFDGRFYVSTVSADEKKKEVTLTLSKDGLLFPEYLRVLDYDLPGGKRYVNIKNDVYYSRLVEFDKGLPRGSVVFTTEEAESVFVIRPGEDRPFEYPFLSGDDTRIDDIVLNRAYPYEQTEIGVKKAFPSLDFICARNGRLCGVSNAEKKIYMSSKTNPDRFFDINGGALSANDPTDGEFTGVCCYNNALCCFKENGIIKVFGEKESDFYLASYSAEGVAASSARSLVSFGGLLYYKGADGFYSYGGSYPKRISDSLGETNEKVLSACVFKNVYYAATEKGLLSLDLKTGLWNENSGVLCSVIKPYEDKLCFCSDGVVKKFDEDKTPEKWSVSFAPFYGRGHGKKTLFGVSLRLELLKGAFAELYISEDGAPFKRVKTIPCGEERCVSVKLKTPLCERFSLMLSGGGGFKLKSLERIYKEKNR